MSRSRSRESSPSKSPRPSPLRFRTIAFGPNEISTYEIEGTFRKKTPQRKSNTRSRLVGIPKSVPMKLSSKNARLLVEKYSDRLNNIQFDLDSEDLITRMTGQKRLIGHRRITESRIEDIEAVYDNQNLNRKEKIAEVVEIMLRGGQ